MKKLLIIALICSGLSMPPHAKAAIAFDAFSSGGTAIPATTLSWSHTVTGANPMLCVGNFGAAAGGGAGSITSITYNGVSLTKVFDSQLAGNSFERWINWWCGTGVGSGTHNITINQTPNDLIMPLGCSYNGVNQSTPEATSQTDSTTTSNVNTISIVTTNAWHIMYAAANPTITMSTNATSRGSNLTSAQTYCADENGALSTGNHSMTITLGTAGNSTTDGIDVAPAVASDSLLFGGD